MKKRRGERKERRDRLSEQSSASKEERELVIKEKRINEFTSRKKQQILLEERRKWMTDTFNFYVNTCHSFIQYVVCKCGNIQLSLKVINLQKQVIA